MYESLSMWILPLCCLKLFLQAQDLLIVFSFCLMYLILNPWKHHTVSLNLVQDPQEIPKTCFLQESFSVLDVERKKCDQVQHWHSPPLRCSTDKSLLPLTQLTRTVKFWLLPLFYRGWQRAPEFNTNWRSLVQLGMRANSWASSTYSFHLSASPEIDWIPKHYRIFTVHAFAKKDDGTNTLKEVKEKNMGYEYRSPILFLSLVCSSLSPSLPTTKVSRLQQERPKWAEFQSNWNS